jgi:hypothetical protein
MAVFSTLIQVMMCVLLRFSFSGPEMISLVCFSQHANSNNNVQGALFTLRQKTRVRTLWTMPLIPALVRKQS